MDNGSDAAGRALLEGLPAERIDPGRNLGYAGGVNLGVARSKAELILLMNPDVIVLPGCVPALLEVLRDGAAVAGPRFYWDRGRRLVQPPAELRGRREELAALLAGRSPAWAARARRRWRRHARRHWEARSPLPSHALSGSLLALPPAGLGRGGAVRRGVPALLRGDRLAAAARSRGLASRVRPGGRGGPPLQPERRAGAAGPAAGSRSRRTASAAGTTGLVRGRCSKASTAACRASGTAPVLPRVPPDGL